MMKLTLFFALGIAAFVPWGIAAGGQPLALLMGAVLLILKLLLGGVIMVLIETGLAKMRIFRVPEYLGSAFLLATLGMIAFFILE